MNSAFQEVKQNFVAKLYWYTMHISFTETIICFVALFALVYFAIAEFERKGSLLFRSVFFKALYVFTMSIWMTMLAAITLLGREGIYQNTSSTFLSSFNELLKGNRLVIFDILFNVILFIPCGFLLEIKFNSRVAFSIILIIIISVECAQLLTMRGFFEVADILANAIGGTVGIYFAHMFKK